MVQTLRRWIIACCLAMLRWLDADEAPAALSRARRLADLLAGADERAADLTRELDALRARLPDDAMAAGDQTAALLDSLRDDLERANAGLAGAHTDGRRLAAEREEVEERLRDAAAECKMLRGMVTKRAPVLSDAVLALLPVATKAVAYAEAIGKSPRQKHAIALRWLHTRVPASELRDASLAVVLAHRRGPAE